MSNSIAQPRRWVHLLALSAGLMLYTTLASAQAKTVNRARALPGTYQVVFCRHMCTMADSDTAIATGYIVLSEAPIKLTELPTKQRAYFSGLYKSVALHPTPNACFMMTKPASGSAAAAALPVGFTSWEIHQRTVHLDFFRAPDSGYTLYLILDDGATVHGVGQFWSGNESGTQQTDSVTGRRIGPPRPDRCINAARHTLIK